jgi:hypothetical protein
LNARWTPRWKRLGTAFRVISAAWARRSSLMQYGDNIVPEILNQRWRVSIGVGYCCTTPVPMIMHRACALGRAASGADGARIVVADGRSQSELVGDSVGSDPRKSSRRHSRYRPGCTDAPGAGPDRRSSRANAIRAGSSCAGRATRACSLARHSSTRQADQRNDARPAFPLRKNGWTVSS